MSDGDGDSTMHSSPRSSVSDDLFPGAETTTTTTTTTTTATPSAAGARATHPINTSVGDSSSSSGSGGGGVALPSTPAANVIKTAELSPPNSQGAPPGLSGGAGATDATTINANGKRVYYAANAHGNGGDGGSIGGGKGKAPLDLNAGGEELAEGAADAVGAGSRLVAPSVHAASGYRWEREADAPGWTWKNKKSQEEWYKAEETFVDRDRMVRATYGDPLLDAGQQVGV